MRELALFAGAGGGILGGKLLGWRTVCAVEIDEYCRRVLRARQRDGVLEDFPIHQDVRDFDGLPWRGRVDIITGGFPCQDISSAGKRAGINGERSGLWHEFARVIREVEPRFAFIENSPHLRTRGLDVVLGDLARMGFNAEWGVLGADAVGAPHRRRRMWILAYANDARERVRSIDEEMGMPPKDVRGARCDAWWPMDIPSRVDDGLAHRMDRVRATGNGQVASVAALAWRVLAERAGIEG